MRKLALGWICPQYVAITLYGLVLCVTIGSIYKTSKAVEKPVFSVNKNIPAGSTLPIFESYIIPEPDSLKTSHSATLEVLHNGDLIAFWFAGSHEGKPDVKIWSSKFINNQWTYATAVISPQMLSDRLFQYIRKVGNPVAYLDPRGILHLFVVSVGAIGGWSVSNINHLESLDNGQTWQKAQRLILTPFINISTLVRTSVVPLSDGGFYLPVYAELLYTYPELLRFDQNGQFIQKIRMSSKKYMLQPAVVANDQLIAYSFLRNKARNNEILYMQSAKKGGLAWSRPRPTNLTNQDSSLAVGKLSDGRLLMVHNPEGRNKLVLSASSDGVSWHSIKTLEDTPNQEYSYPSIQIHNGLIDIVYTYQRQRIKHVRLNEAWLNQIDKEQK